MEKIWNIRNKDIDDSVVLNFQKRLNGYLDFQLTKMIVSRLGCDVEAVRRFLRPNLDMLHDPFLFRDMYKAIDRLCLAIDGGESIMVYGDYDVDGTTSVALVYSFLMEYFGERGLDTQRLSYYVPDRYTEGYGVSFKGVDKAIEKGCSLIIALDCGNVCPTTPRQTMAETAMPIRIFFLIDSIEIPPYKYICTFIITYRLYNINV